MTKQAPDGGTPEQGVGRRSIEMPDGKPLQVSLRLSPQLRTMLQKSEFEKELLEAALTQIDSVIRSYVAQFEGDRAAVLQLVKRLPPSQIEAARKFLSFLVADADEDVEPLSVSEQEALERGKQQAAKGETVSLEDLKRELDQDA